MHIGGSPAAVGLRSSVWRTLTARQVAVQVGDVLAERTVWRRPEDIPPEQKSIHWVTAADAPGDLAGQMVAGLVAGTLALASQRDPGLISEEKASTNIYYAHRLFTSVMLSPKLSSQVCWSSIKVFQKCSVREAEWTPILMHLVVLAQNAHHLTVFERKCTAGMFEYKRR
jgi:hypothetical protein